MNPPIEEQAKEAMKCINFRRIHRTMKALNWVYHWEIKTPTVERLKITCQQLIDMVLKMVREHPRSSPDASTGGFYVAWCCRSKVLTVHFCVESYEYLP
jgi:hypothetical protein